MKSETVFLPIYRGIVHAQIEQGMHWSIVEHLVLFALTRQLVSMDALARHANLPKSIVIEAIARLMRAGWVEVITDETGAHFQASVSGREEAEKESLTPIVRRVSRNLHYAIDRVTGSLIGIENVTLMHERDSIEQRRRCKTLRPIKTVESKWGYLELIDRLSTIQSIIRSDERIAGCDPYRSNIEEGWHLVLTVSGDAIEGLPSIPPPKLVDAIRTEAATFPYKAENSSDGARAELSIDHSLEFHDVDLTVNDLLLGGAAHKTALHEAIANARRRVIVHSTFLSTVRLEEHLETLRMAAARKVRVDLLWDKSEEGKDNRTLNECRALLKRAGLQEFIKLSSFQTRSHSKQLIADDGVGGYFALVGSCNWLSSPFKSYEVSVRLRCASLVSRCAAFIERMLPLGSDAEDLKRDLVTLGLQLRHASSTRGTARVSLLSQGDHETIVAKARDSARSSIFVASNKAGNALETQVLAPLASAAEQRPPLDVAVYYQSERKESALTTDVLEGLKRTYRRINIETVRHAHAKLLCWDSDHAVISSLNWLSKDASAANFVGECGVYIEQPGIADLVRRSYLRESRAKG